MENLKEIPLEVAQMSIWLDVEKAHQELCDLAQAHREAVDVGDRIRIKDRMRERGETLLTHFDAILECELGDAERLMWEKSRSQFHVSLELFGSKDDVHRLH